MGAEILVIFTDDLEKTIIARSVCSARRLAGADSQRD